VRGKTALLWLFLLGGGIAIAVTAAVNSAAAKAVAIGVGGGISGMAATMLLFARRQA